LGGASKKNIADMETKIALLSQEIERLNSILEKKNQDIGNYTKKIAEFEHLMNSNVQESETYKNRINKLMTENNSLGD